MSDQITSTQDRQVAWEANATTQADPGTGTQQLLHELQTLFRVAAHETFEFGMESEFVTALESSAVPSLKAAIAKEPIYELRKDMESVLARLERAT